MEHQMATIKDARKFLISFFFFCQTENIIMKPFVITLLFVRLFPDVLSRSLPPIYKQCKICPPFLPRKYEYRFSPSSICSAKFSENWRKQKFTHIHSQMQFAVALFHLRKNDILCFKSHDILRICYFYIVLVL